MELESTGLPTARTWSRLLGVSLDDAAARLQPYLERSLLEPVRDLMARPHKGIRAHLVDSGYALALDLEGQPAADNSTPFSILAGLAQAIELLHGGSLIVDDIQDGSSFRRGGDSIHRKYGEPRAITSGNWLYFYPLEIIRSLALPNEVTQKLYEAFHRAVERAHYGQSLDVSLRIDDVPQRDVPVLVQSIMELKTGSLTNLGLLLGGHVAGLSCDSEAKLSELGKQFGVALQMFDDIGNLASRKDPTKRLEDLVNRRLSWVWGFAAREFDSPQYQDLLAVTRCLPDETALESFFQKTRFVQRAKAHSANHIRHAIDSVLPGLTGLAKEAPSLRHLVRLGESLVDAF